MRGVLGRAAAAFERAFGHAPKAAAFAPGRVNLIGDHTDYAGGLAMPMALGLGCVAVASMCHDQGVCAVAADLDERFEAPAGTPAAGWPGWARYVCGPAMLAADALGLSGGVRLAVASDVPIGGGLSSSAAVEVAVISAVEVLAGTTLDPQAKARLAQRAEHEFAGVPCGLLDPLAAVFGREGHALMIDFADLAVRHVRVPDEAAFLVVDSGVRHDNASGAYADLRRRAERARAELGVEELGRASLAEVQRLEGGVRAVAGHVISECQRVRAFADALSRGDLASAGGSMNEGHRSLADRLGAAPPEVEVVADRVRRAPGVLGCRMTGAGFGGCVVALTSDPARTTAALAGLHVTHALPGDGCRAIPIT